MSHKGQRVPFTRTYDLILKYYHYLMIRIFLNKYYTFLLLVLVVDHINIFEK